MKKIKLTQGKFALVDDENFEWLSKWKWYVSVGYAVRCVKIPKTQTSKRSTKSVLMHREIMNTPRKMYTDHKDGNRLNNQKSNLRVCTPTQNISNSKKHSNGKSSKFTSKFKGVFVYRERYRSHIRLSGKRIVRSFPYTPEGEIQAAKWYNEQAQKHHGEFALINLI